MARGLATRGRFAVAYLLLGAAVGLAVGGAIVLAQREGPQPGPPWSSWEPTTASTSSREFEIAQHVASGYKLPTGDQLVSVKLGGSNNGQTFGGVAIVKPNDPRSLERSFEPKSTAVFILCGDNTSTPCAITQGEPTVARRTVLRREALELALYTMEYAKPIDNVLIFFPPAKGQKKLSSTLFFSRDNLSGSLKHPLRRTLPQATPPVPGKIAPRESKTVDDLTASALYHYLGIAQNVIVIQQPSSPSA